MANRKRPPVIWRQTTKYKDGETIHVRVKVKPAEVKKTIMRANDWTEEQYRKQYDLFKNKLRAFENYKRAHGVDVEEQSPLEILYRAAKSKIKYGSEYTPTLAMQRIQAFSAVSITKGKQLAADLESEYSRRRGETFEKTTRTAFKEFIEQVGKAAEIDAAIDDPVKKEEALKALAEHIKAKQAPSGEVFASGETYGSDEAGEDFDYSEWLQ